MIDPSYTFILEALKNVQKEVGGEDSYDNGQSSIGYNYSQDYSTRTANPSASWPSA